MPRARDSSPHAAASQLRVAATSIRLQPPAYSLQPLRHGHPRPHPRAARQERLQDRHVVGRRPGRPAADSRAGKTELETAKHAEPRRARPRRRLRRQHPRRSRASPPAAGRGTWACSATTRSSTSSAAAPSKPPASASSSQPGDVAIRGNFCTLDAAGNITDRRAGRIASEESAPLADQAARGEDSRRRGLRRAGEGAPLRRRLPRRHGRWAATSTTPIRKPPACRRSTPSPTTPASRRRPRSPTSSSQQATQAARRRAEGQRPDAPRLRRQARICRATKKSTASRPRRSPSIRCTRAWPSWSAWTSSATPRRSTSRWTCSKQNWTKYDFFFIHFKYTDSTGEDGNFAAKVKRIEEFDAAMPRITALKPDVLIVTGDHSTPSMLEEPQLAPGADAAGGPSTAAPTAARRFGESECRPRRPGAVRGQVPDDAGAGQRGAAGEVRGMKARPCRVE